MDPYITPTSISVGRVFAEALASGPVTQSDLEELFAQGRAGEEPEVTSIRLGYALLVSRYYDLFSDRLVEAAMEAMPILVKLQYSQETDADEISRIVETRRRSYAPVVMILNAASVGFSWGTHEEAEAVAAEQVRLLQNLLAGRFPSQLKQLQGISD